MNEKINLKDLFRTDEEFLKTLESLKKKIKKIKKYEGKLYESPEVLYEFLILDTCISKDLEKLYLYSHINNDLDLTNEKYQTYYGMVVNLASDLSLMSSFVCPEILSKDYSFFLNFVKKYPKLGEYKNNIKSIFRAKKYTKSKEEEKIISLLTTSYDRPSMISELLINTDLDYGTIKEENNKDVQLTNSNFSTYIESKSRNVRKEAFTKFYKQYANHENTFASILANEIINNNKISELRNFKSSRELSLYRSEIKNNIFDNLINGISKNLNIFYKYYDLKKEVLKLDEMHIYDTYASIVKDYEKKYSYKDAKNIILESLGILGKDYISVINKAFEDNWIDVYPKKNKRDGGYCTCAYLTHPYLVINYEEKLNDVSTLAHELGHAMQYYYAQKNNAYQDYSYSIFVAEVASQVNEIILTNYLLNKSNDAAEKKYLIDLILQRFKSTMIRQTMFAEFEDLLHNLEKSGNILTKELITNKYYELNQKYFGPNVVVDDEIKYECFRIPHFYYNFYVYQYATGYAAAMKIANDIMNKKENALENYLKFLKLGSTKDPVSSLKVAGVDIENTEIYNDIFKVFNDYLDRLKELI